MWFRAYHRTQHLVCLPKTKSVVCEVLKEGKIKLYVLLDGGVLGVERIFLFYFILFLRRSGTANG